VSQAFFLTATIVVGLTMYTLQSKSDFSWLGGILMSLLTVSFIGGLLHVKKQEIFYANLIFEIIQMFQIFKIFFRNSAMETMLTMLVHLFSRHTLSTILK